MRKNYTRSEFILKAREVHGWKYDYSKVVYVDYTTEVCIICPIHGEFWQSPKNHLRGYGCQECGKIKAKESGSRGYDVEERKAKFIAKANKVHNSKYDYSKTVYKNRRTPIIVTCPEHGDFEQLPYVHMYGHGCPICGDISITIKNRGRTATKNPKKKKKEKTEITIRKNNNGGLSLEERKRIFIENANKVHNNRYDYSKVVYKNMDTEVCIICPDHGEFYQKPGNHLKRGGCPICSQEKQDKYNEEQRELAKENFFRGAKDVHKDTYDYSKVNYVNGDTKICIVCHKHGEFYQTPRDHLRGCGCPYCNQSRLETLIDGALTKLKLPFLREKSLTELTGKQRSTTPQKIDFFIPEIKLCIECQGIQHFTPTDFGCKELQGDALDEAYKITVERDKFKYDALKNAGYDIVYFTDRKNKMFCELGWYKDKTVFYNVSTIVNYVKDKKNKNGDDGNTIVCLYDGQLELNFNECEA